MFISDAFAQQGGAPAGSGMMQIILMVLIFVVFYFLLIRPQQKRAKQHREMVSGLSKGDEVMTSGGMMGTITNTTDNYVVVKVADNVELTFQRASIAQLLPKGTIKGIG